MRPHAELKPGYDTEGKTPESLESLTLHTTGPHLSAGQAHKGTITTFGAVIMPQQRTRGMTLCLEARAPLAF